MPQWVRASEARKCSVHDPQVVSLNLGQYAHSVKVGREQKNTRVGVGVKEMYNTLDPTICLWQSVIFSHNFTLIHVDCVNVLFGAYTSK